MILVKGFMITKKKETKKKKQKPPQKNRMFAMLESHIWAFTFFTDSLLFFFIFLRVVLVTTKLVTFYHYTHISNIAYIIKFHSQAKP